MSTVTNEIQDSVSSLYIAFFGRASDAFGFGYWAQDMANGDSPFDVAANFGRSQEWLSTYGGLTPEQQVNLFYVYTFGREADAEGLAYWVNNIESGLPFTSVAYQIIWAAYLGGEDVDPNDNAIVLNKIEVSEYFAITLQCNDLTLAATAFDGVTEDPATATAAEARLAAAVAPSGETFTLTTGIDAGAAFTGTAYDDTYNATFAVNPATGLFVLPTLNNFDQLNGAGGTNTLNAELVATGAGGTTVSPVSLANIQVINAGSTGALAADIATLNLTNAAQLTTLTNSSSSSAAVFTNVRAGTDVGVSNNSGAASTFTFATAATSGIADSVDLALSSATGAGVITLAGFETVNVTSNGSVANSVSLTAANATTVNASGSAGLTLAGMAVATTINGSGMTGAFTAAIAGAGSLTGGAGNDSLTGANAAVANSVNGGAGNDTITFAGNFAANTATAASNDTVNGGDGFDTLVAISANLEAIDNTVLSARQSISNIEAITVSNALSGNLILANIQAGIERVNLADTAISRNVTFQAAQNATVAAAIDIGGTLTVTSAGTGTAESLTLRNSSAGADVFAARAVTSAGFETVNLVTTTTTAGAAQSISTLAANASATATPVSVNLSGANSLNATAISSTTTGLLSISGADLTAATGNVLTIGGVSVGTAGTISVTGSEGNDVITTGNFASTVNGGGGNDNLTGGTSADVISGGAGADTIVGGGGNDTVTGGDGGDTITVTGTRVNVDGGAGNDTIIRDVAVNDTINGGDGLDTLRITTAITSPAVASGITNVEYLQINTAIAQDMSMFTNTTIARVIAGTDNALTVTNASASTNELVFGVNNAAAVAVSFRRLTDTSTNALTISRIADLAGATTLSTLTISDEETVVLNTATTAAQNFIVGTSLAASDLTSLTITGNGAVNIATGTGLGTTDRTITVDASASTGTIAFDASGSVDIGVALTFTGAATVSSVITGGASSDSITGGTAADVLSGGAGNDTLTGAAGGDNLTGGAGNDILLGGSGNDNLEGDVGNDSLTGGTGIDILDGGDGADQFIFASGDAGITLATADTIDNFTTADDKINTGISGLVAGQVQIVDGATLADFAAFATAAAASFAAGYSVYVSFDAVSSRNAYVAMNQNGGTTLVAGDGVVVLTLIDSVTQIAAANFVI